MDLPLRAPRNRTAEMQLILRLVSQGYCYWTTDQIPRDKLHGFVNKWARYRLLADPAARSWRKQTGKANSALVLEHRFNAQPLMQEVVQDSASEAAHPFLLARVHKGVQESVPASDADQPLGWIMLSTAGKDGLADGLSAPGPVLDARTQEGRILWMGYELVQQQKRYTTADARVKTEITWTWRLPLQRYKELEAHVVSAAKHRQTTTLAQTFAWLSRLPMFAGLRSQVMRLHAEANKMLLKVGCDALPPLTLPFVVMQKLW